MTKWILLLILSALALLLDGTLSYDIFDYRLDSFTDWFGLFLVVIIFVAIIWTEPAKKDNK